MGRKVSTQKKMVVLLQNSSLKLNALFKMVHHSLGFLYALLGLHLVCAVNPVSLIVWWTFVPIPRYVIAVFLYIRRRVKFVPLSLTPLPSNFHPPQILFNLVIILHNCFSKSKNHVKQDDQSA